MTDSTTPDLPEEQLPQEVVAALKNRYGPASPIPESLNAAILADAAGHLKTIAPPRPGSTQIPQYGRRKVWVAISVSSLAAVMLLISTWQGNGANEASFSQLADRSSKQTAGQAGLLKSAADGSASLASAVIDQHDVDQNGVVNILDAFALARSVESHHSNLLRWDQNGDGFADRNDIDLIAMRAVTL